MSGQRVVGICVGLNEQNSTVHLKVFPSITTGKFDVEFGALPEKGAIEIFDLSGKLIYNQEIPKNENKISIDIADVDAGIYFVQIAYAGLRSEVVKILKE